MVSGLARCGPPGVRTYNGISARRSPRGFGCLENPARSRSVCRYDGADPAEQSHVGEAGAVPWCAIYVAIVPQQAQPCQSPRAIGGRS